MFESAARPVFSEFRLFNEPIGNKAEHCRTLVRKGFPVPRSLAISDNAVRKILRDPGNREFEKTLLRTFGADFRSKKFAVRSSSCSEDSSTQSNAGAFLSELPVGFDSLSDSLAHVSGSLEESSERYGILLQEYVPLKIFGVGFTCDPRFSRHAMVVETCRGAGEALVSGKNVPDRVTFSRNVPAPVSRKTPGIDWEFWRKTFLRLESTFGVPQDVEWGISESGNPVVLQSRPVTAFSFREIETLRALDEFEKRRVSEGSSPYLLVRNELCETFDEPTEEETDFLRRLYRHPAVVGTYAKFGISYVPGDFLALVGGRLFVDANAEAECFFPNRSSGFFRRLATKWKNAFRLGAVGARLRNPADRTLDLLEERLLSAWNAALDLLSRPKRPDESEILSMVYAPVFEANFLASSFAAREGLSERSGGGRYFPSERDSWIAAIGRLKDAGLRGNSLAFSDASTFSTPLFERTHSPAGLPTDVSVSARLDFLREAGRAVSVMVANLLRDPGRLSSRSRPKGEGPRVPESLVSPLFLFESGKKERWDVLSDGEAAGVLTDAFWSMPQSSRERGEWVLLVDALDPSILSELPRSVVAVVSARGGRLSHFAIVARERGLPTFLDAEGKSRAHLGKRVKVGASGIEAV